MPEIKVHVKTIVSPAISLAEMIEAARLVYGSVGIEFTFLSHQALDLPGSHTVDIGSACLFNSVSEQQRELYENRDGVPENEVAAYFVGTIIPPHSGCAGHLAGRPSVLIDSLATRWTLAHEVGHLLLGPRPHETDTTRLMTASTQDIEVSLPLITDAEAADMQASPYYFP